MIQATRIIAPQRTNADDMTRDVSCTCNTCYRRGARVQTIAQCDDCREHFKSVDSNNKITIIAFVLIVIGVAFMTGIQVGKGLL